MAVVSVVPKQCQDHDIEDTVEVGGAGGPSGKALGKPLASCLTCRRAMTLLALALVLGGGVCVAAGFWLHAKEEGMAVLHVSGLSVDDADAVSLFHEMESGRHNISVRMFHEAADGDPEGGHLGSTLNVEIESFVPVREAMRNWTLSPTSVVQIAVLINSGSGGYAVGNKTVTSLVCDFDGSQERNCALKVASDDEEEAEESSTGPDEGRGLMDTNEAIVYTTGIVVLGAVAVACMSLCTGPIAVTAGAVSVTAGCFPGSARVQTSVGFQPMSSLSIGTLLLTSQGFSPVFLSGHHDPVATSRMVRITLATNHTLTLTPDHYVPLHAGDHRSAGNLALGDELLVQVPDEFLIPAPITDLEEVWETGLFNPYTIADDIVVDGVLASSHSSWFLEGLTSDEGRIVAAYGAAMAPLKALYRLHPGWFRRFHGRFKGEPLSLSEVSWPRIFWAAASTVFAP